MSTAVRARAHTATEPNGGAPAAVGDVFVIFGITGDLAKVMTFHSLYRLERRGLLTAPIVGVAANDWSSDELRDHARTAIEDCGEHIDDAVFERLAGRLSYLGGDFDDRATYDWGPKEADRLVAELGGWRGPRVAS